MIQNSQKYKSILKIILIALTLIPCMIFLSACGGEEKKSSTDNTNQNTNQAIIYNTKDMSDEQILSYFSDKVLQDIKNDTYNRTIIVYNVGSDIDESVEIKWTLSLDGNPIITDETSSNYVDEDKPESETRNVSVVIGWAEEDLDKVWDFEIYYMDNDSKVVLSQFEINVTSEDFVKVQ